MGRVTLSRLGIIKNPPLRYAESSPKTIRLAVTVATLKGALAPVANVLLITLSGLLLSQKPTEK